MISAGPGSVLSLTNMKEVQTGPPAADLHSANRDVATRSPEKEQNANTSPSMTFIYASKLGASGVELKCRGWNQLVL
jgi:hypothetical protein